MTNLTDMMDVLTDEDKDWICKLWYDKYGETLHHGLIPFLDKDKVVALCLKEPQRAWRDFDKEQAFLLKFGIKLKSINQTHHDSYIKTSELVNGMILGELILDHTVTTAEVERLVDGEWKEEVVEL